MSTQDNDERGISPFLKALSLDQIVDAVNRSPDNGVTLFLSKLGISDIGPYEAEELAYAGQHGFQEGSRVERLTLGNNRLSTLPLEFELFTRLRYINLKHNLLSIFPEVLTSLPCLDILDVSHNKIRRLPLQPGNLSRLRVFCLSRNKVTRLPTYISQFRQLDVLQIDRNPIEWPPRSAMESFGDLQDIQKGKEWIVNLQTWLEADGAKDKEYDDSGYSEQPEWEPEGSYDTWPFPVRQGTFDAGPTPHARSFSLDSVSSVPDSPLCDQEQTRRGEVGPLAVPDSTYDQTGQQAFQSPKLSASSSGDTFYMSSPTLSKSAYKDAAETEPMHLRTTSHASSLREAQVTTVPPKKSLPDLRSASKDFEKMIPPLPESYSALIPDEPSILPPTSLQQNFESLYTSQSEQSRISDGRSHSFVAAERSSYFQRSSSMPLNNSLPRPLAYLIETARSILFSLGALHQTLDRCVNHGTFDRSSLKFKKVLDPANVTMLHLIRSLDRFDDVSQQSLPSPAICRGLVECCRDTITAFRKSLGLLISQSKLEPTSDARFSRWLVLELYGILGEISLAWQTMSSELESLKPFLSGSSFSQFSSFAVNGAQRSQPHDLQPAVRLRSADGNGTAAKVGKARRHAGSFSSKDVEIGKELPSYDIIPTTAGGLATHTHIPTLRTPKRQITVPLLSNPSSNGSYFTSISSSSFPPDGYDHMRQHSHGSFHDSPSLISPITPVESPSSTRTHISRDVLQVMQTAVQVAPMVWDQIERALSDVSLGDPDIRDNLDNARAATRKLARDIANVSDEDLESDGKLLRENAYGFVKIVVQLSNILKTHSNPRSVTAALRSNMVKLANSTQEFASLLQFPSISYTPRSSSPASSTKYATYSLTSFPFEDNLLSSSLSRATSAQSSSNTTKAAIPSSYDFQPTLPLSIKGPNRRIRPTREPSIDDTEQS
ncbi:hypothetical protein BDN70DRAFT_245050 [Pholiota conissans]|uniref:Leucine-rich repeat-containing protein n=1 Tax=Pholiota conissans TaxID=109636 RepID=A0A9P6CXA7_9AGAR|nr:hypothetical protein BDN70DRAFT_245050 [Pholiota conissans]